MKVPALFSIGCIGIIFALACASDEEKASVEAICAMVDACPSYDWTLDECNDGWLNNSNYGTYCEAEAEYLRCVDPCLDLTCDEFEQCEASCWLDTCL